MEKAFERSSIVLGKAAMDVLGSSRVIVFGIGGVGSWCAEALVRTGLRNLTIVDFDEVAESNLNRQAMATIETLGEAKTEAMARRLKAVNPAAEITAIKKRAGKDTLKEFGLGDYDYIVDAIDSVEDKAELILSASAEKRPVLVSSMGAALRTRPDMVAVCEFGKVQGDGLARALRHKFRKWGRMPEKPFNCVYSREMPVTGEAEGRGSLITVTATFGMTLAALILAEIKKSACNGGQKMV